jgi:hypothetical protein
VKAPAFQAELRIRHGSPESLGRNMNNPPLKPVVYFVLGSAITAAVAYQIHRHSEFGRSSRDMHLAMEDRVSIFRDPPSEKLEEAEVFAGALEFAERGAQEKIRALFPSQSGPVKLKLIPRSSGYEVVLFAPEISSEQREAISKIITEEIVAGQRQSTTIALEATQRTSESKNRSPNQALQGTPAKVPSSSTEPEARRP